MHVASNNIKARIQALSTLHSVSLDRYIYHASGIGFVVNVFYYRLRDALGAEV